MYRTIATYNLFSLQTSTVNEETTAVEEDVSSGAEVHDNVRSIVTQQVSTGVASCSTDDNLMHHIEDSQWIAISVMCTFLSCFLPVKLTRSATHA